MEGLGRSFDLVISQIAAQKRAYVGDVSAVSFVIVDPAANAVTLQQHTLFSGGTTAALNFAKFYTQTAGVWTEVANSPVDNTFTPAGTEDLVVVEIDTKSLSDGFKYVSGGIATAGTVIYIAHDLDVQRKPVNMRRLDA